MESPPAVMKASDVLLWLVNHVGKFPRSHRFVLGERIETRMLTVRMRLVEAADTRDKIPLLQKPAAPAAREWVG